MTKVVRKVRIYILDIRGLLVVKKDGFLFAFVKRKLYLCAKV